MYPIHSSFLASHETFKPQSKQQQQQQTIAISKYKTAPGNLHRI
jgi:hypothetical protein